MRFLIPTLVLCCACQPQIVSSNAEESGSGGTQGSTSSETEAAATTDAGTTMADTDASTGPEPDSGSTAGSDTGDTEGDDGVAALPFGGNITWSVNTATQSLTGMAFFYEIEFPDHPDYVPSPVTVPYAGPLTAVEERWRPSGGPFEPDPNDGLPEPVITRLNPGPVFYVHGGGVTLAMSLFAEAQMWVGSGTPYRSPFEGMFEIEMPGNSEFPAQTMSADVLDPGAASVQTNPSGVPLSLRWEPSGAHSIDVTLELRGPTLNVYPWVCTGRLVDDGDAAIGPECTISTADIPAGVTQVVFIVRHKFERDVQYGDYRVRLSWEVRQDIPVPYPFG